jgi:hypothetical protein
MLSDNLFTRYLNIGTQWFLMLGSILSGMTDGLMYTVEGPVIVGALSPANYIDYRF